MSKVFKCSIEVRGYEIDSFGHVNHATYINYLEHARWTLLKEMGMGLETFEDWQQWPVISKIEIQYLKPTFTGDYLEIQTRLIENTRSSMTFEQTILKNQTPVVQAQLKAVMVDRTGRPTKIPDQLQKGFDS